MKYLVAGLGNIGPEYEDTRHNIGFKILDALAKASNISFKDKRYGFIGELKYKARTIILLKPSTYMNLSGKAIHYWLQKEKISIDKLFVMLDDIALDVEPRTRVLLLQRLAQHGIEITTGCKLKSIGSDDIVAEAEGRELRIPVDGVVLAVGCKANTELENKLKEDRYKVYTIGDCRDPANIKAAVHQGFRVICEHLETTE